jgi:MSHA biogenesis protein MshK
MDEAVKTMLALVSVLACCGPALAGPALAGQTLQDPTRPPANMMAGAAATTTTTSAAGPQLQTILIGRAPGGRHLAVIDGETVRPGDDFHGARVARIADNEVELVRGRERHVLRLVPTLAEKGAGGMSPVRSTRGQ